MTQKIQGWIGKFGGALSRQEETRGVFAVFKPDAGQNGSQQEKNRHQNQEATTCWFDDLWVGCARDVGRRRFHSVVSLFFGLNHRVLLKPVNFRKFPDGRARCSRQVMLSVRLGNF
jgi:hypothetical protein